MNYSCSLESNLYQMQAELISVIILNERERIIHMLMIYTDWIKPTLRANFDYFLSLSFFIL